MLSDMWAPGLSLLVHNTRMTLCWWLLHVCCAPPDMKALQPQEDEVKELNNHVIIAGYGRVGQIIAQMLSELVIPFVALDVRSDR